MISSYRFVAATVMQAGTSLTDGLFPRAANLIDPQLPVLTHYQNIGASPYEPCTVRMPSEVAQR